MKLNKEIITYCRILLVVSFFFIFLPIGSSAVIDLVKNTQNGCTNISSAGLYNLSRTLIPNGTVDCLRLQQDNIEINCYGNKIGGNETYGISLINFQLGKNVTLIGCVLNRSAPSAIPIVTASNNSNGTLISTTYQGITTENVTSGSRLFRYWYFSANVNDDTLNALGSVLVTLKNVSNSITYQDYSTLSGITNTSNLLEYVNNGTDIVFTSNYTINATKTGYIDANYTFNLTQTLDQTGFTIILYLNQQSIQRTCVYSTLNSGLTTLINFFVVIIVSIVLVFSFGMISLQNKVNIKSNYLVLGVTVLGISGFSIVIFVTVIQGICSAVG